MKDLTRGRPLTLILRFAIPVMLGNLFQLFYNLADTRIVGSFLGDDALAAVGATNSLNSMLIGLLLGMATGFAITTARHFGANDRDNVRRSVGVIFFWSMVFAGALTILLILTLEPLLRVLHTPENLIGDSVAYFRIILLGTIVTMLYDVCASVLRAIGDSITPLLFLILAATLNVGLDLLFVCVFHWGVVGAAAATVSAQAFSVILCMIYVKKRYPWIWPSLKECKPTALMTGQLFGAGLSMALMMSLVNIGSIILQGAINTFGTEIIVAHTAARRLTELFMLPFVVLGQAMATFAGQNMGAGKHERIRIGVRDTLILSWIWCAIVVVLSHTIVPSLIQLITGTDSLVSIENGSRYLRVDTLFYGVTSVISISRNTLQGIGDHITPIISSSLELIGKALIVVLLVPSLGYFGIILAEPIIWFIMSVPLIVMLIRHPVMRRPSDPSKELKAVTH